MKKIETEIVIASTPDKVWHVLTDFGSYLNWNPFIRSIEGEQKVGAQLTVMIQPVGGGSMRFKPVVLAFEQNKEFRWKGKLGISGIFDGEHFFKLIAQNDGTTKLVHGENFSGILVGLLGGMFQKTKAGFELMNESLKAVCEKDSALEPKSVSYYQS